MPTPIEITGGVPELTCYPGTPQELWAAFWPTLSASLSETFPGVYIGESTPAAQFQDRAWFKPSVNRWYYFINGDWMRKYEEPASSGRLIAWIQSDALLTTYGGGSVGAVSDTTGPLWEPATDYDGRVLVGIGVIPGTAISIASVGDTQDTGGLSGERTHALSSSEMPPHTHDLKIVAKNSAASGAGEITSGDNNTIDNGIPKFTTDSTGGNTDTPPVVVAHNNMMPYKAVRWAKRTARTMVFPPY